MEPTADVLSAYADLLATTGVDHGLIGPREVPRLWERHILNCAVVADPALGLLNGCVGDVGSGAGLPGLVWAIVHPNLQVVLIEPLLRRATFLSETVEVLGLGDRVSVLRGRAEELPRMASWVALDCVTARAVAALDKLIPWTAPLVRSGGQLVLLKGSSAAAEIEAAAATARAYGVNDLEIRTFGAPWVEPETTVVIGRVEHGRTRRA